MASDPDTIRRTDAMIMPEMAQPCLRQGTGCCCCWLRTTVWCRGAAGVRRVTKGRYARVGVRVPGSDVGDLEHGGGGPRRNM